MPLITDSYSSVKNEDGSITTTEVSTYTPPTKKENAIALTALAGILLVPFVPVGIAVFADRREARKEKKRLEAEAAKKPN